MVKLFKSESAQYYSTGFSCDNAIILEFEKSNYFITDSRYTTEAKEFTYHKTEVVENRDLLKEAISQIRKIRPKQLIIDPNEWSIEEFKKLNQKLSFLTIKQKKDFLARNRVIKNDNEIELIKEAATLGANSFDSFLKEIKYGNFDEYSLNFKALEVLTIQGRRKISFDPITAINKNSAKPHALPTNKKLKNGDLLLVDAGVKYDRYCSDRTRTIEFNQNAHFKLSQNFTNKKRQKIYDIVLKAHDKAIENIKTGMMAYEIDKIARDIIDKSGYGKFFVHSLGHGVGLDIHEHPYINSKNKEIIKDNMVFTIEPGIYLPNEFGVRIEDMVVIKNGRAMVLG